MTLSIQKLRQRPKAYPLLALDFDGVIVDSVDIKTQAIAQLFAEEREHVAEIVAFHVRNLGLNRERKFERVYRDILERSLPLEKKAALNAEYKRLVMEAVIACPIMVGAEEFLATVSPFVPTYIVSATPQDELLEIVGRRNLASYFRGVYGGPRSKDVILKELLTVHGLSGSDMLYAGDSYNDYTAAKEADIAFVAITDNGRAEPFPQQILQVSDLRDLTDVVLGAER